MPLSTRTHALPFAAPPRRPRRAACALKARSGPAAQQSSAPLQSAIRRMRRRPPPVHCARGEWAMLSRLWQPGVAASGADAQGSARVPARQPAQGGWVLFEAVTVVRRVTVLR